MKASKMITFLKSYSIQDYFQTIPISQQRMLDLSLSNQPLLELTNNEYSALQSFIDKTYQYEDYIYDTSNFIDFKSNQFIGIDIGISKIMTCSDNQSKKQYHTTTMNQYDNNKIFRRAIQHLKTIDSIKEESRSSKKRKRRIEHENRLFKSDILKHLKTIIQDIICFYGPNKVYLLGESELNYVKDLPRDQITINLLKKIIYETFFDYLYKSGLNCFVLEANESVSSIKCPICKHKHQTNRTKTNQFKCRRCGYFNKNDDIVACMNIVNRHISLL